MRSLFVIVFICVGSVLAAQEFFKSDFDRAKRYVVLVNPTTANIEKIDFLVKRKVLGVDPTQTEFVGLYHKAQKYDFEKTVRYITEKGLSNFHLHGVVGDLTAELVYRTNPCTSDFGLAFSNSVGTIFFGGADIPPGLYGEENRYASTDDPLRHYFDLSLLFHLIGGARDAQFRPLLELKPDYFVTGFCLGMQSANVAAGGSLWQDIPCQLYHSELPERPSLADPQNLHRNYWRNISKATDLMSYVLHPIELEKEGFFSARLKAAAHLRPLVYSSHHQAIKELAPNYAVSSRSVDGKIIESIAHTQYANVFFVQFHPEMPELYEDRARVRLSPDDTPNTVRSMLDQESRNFHQALWQHITVLINRDTNSIAQ